MIFRQLKKEKYDNFTMQLIQKAQKNPIEASFSVAMTVNNSEYVLKIQPERKCKLFILQAIKSEGSDGCLYRLVTDNNLLLSLLNILVWQWVN